MERRKNSGEIILSSLIIGSFIVAGIYLATTRLTFLHSAATLSNLHSKLELANKSAIDTTNGVLNSVGDDGKRFFEHNFDGVFYISVAEKLPSYINSIYKGTKNKIYKLGGGDTFGPFKYSTCDLTSNSSHFVYFNPDAKFKGISDCKRKITTKVTFHMKNNLSGLAMSNVNKYAYLVAQSTLITEKGGKQEKLEKKTISSVIFSEPSVDCREYVLPEVDKPDGINSEFQAIKLVPPTTKDSQGKEIEKPINIPGLQVEGGKDLKIYLSRYLDTVTYPDPSNPRLLQYSFYTYHAQSNLRDRYFSTYMLKYYTDHYFACAFYPSYRKMSNGTTVSFWEDPVENLIYNKHIPITGIYKVGPNDKKSGNAIGHCNTVLTSQLKALQTENNNIPTGYCKIDNGGWTKKHFITIEAELDPDMAVKACKPVRFTQGGAVAGVRHNGCFDPDTKVTMFNGREMNITDLSMGHRLINPVTGKIVHVVDVVAGPETSEMYLIGTEKGEVKVTKDHPIKLTKGLIVAADVKVGDATYDVDGSTLQITKVERLAPSNEQEVYNILVSGDSANEEDHYIIANGMVMGDLYLQNKLNKN